MPSPARNPFGDALLCPICFVIYEGRIYQCSQGHAVCEKCQLKLTECPHCRCSYMGTRNYVLEEVIPKLRVLNALSNVNLGNDDAATKVAEDKKNESANTSTKEAPSDAATTQENVDRPAWLFTGPSESSSEEDLLNWTSTTVDDLLSNIMVYSPPVQAKGRFVCRMLNCNKIFPICRLLNHLRYSHKEHLSEMKEETNPNEGYVINYSINFKTTRKVVHLRNYGIFFIVINVVKVAGEPTKIQMWVQCACPNNDARKFKYTCELSFGNRIGSYTDYVYGSQSDAPYISATEKCLTIACSSKLRTLSMVLKIFRNIGPFNMPRNSNTTLRNNEAVLAQQNANNQRNDNNGTNAAEAAAAAPTRTGRGRRRNRNRRR